MLPDVGIDGEVCIQCALKLTNVDLDCYCLKMCVEHKVLTQNSVQVMCGAALSF